MRSYFAKLLICFGAALEHTPADFLRASLFLPRSTVEYLVIYMLLNARYTRLDAPCTK